MANKQKTFSQTLDLFFNFRLDKYCCGYFSENLRLFIIEHDTVLPSLRTLTQVLVVVVVVIS